jgi:hypothetical protein
MSLYFCKKKRNKNCCKIVHYIKGAKEGAYKFELHVAMHYHDDQLYIYIFLYVFIWFLINHHYLCQCNIHFMDMKRHMLICFFISMLIDRGKK